MISFQFGDTYNQQVQLMFTGFRSACLIMCQLASSIRAQSILGNAQDIRHIDQNIKLFVG